MGWPALLMLAVIALWVIPSAVTSNVALALLSAWAVGELWWLATGNALPVPIYFLTDAACICYLIGYRQFLPRAVVALYPLCWSAYVWIDDARTQWFALYWLTLAQFILAGPWGRIRSRWNELGGVGHGQSPVSGDHHSAVSADLHALEAPVHGALDRGAGANAQTGGLAR